MTLRLNGATSGYTEIDAPAVAGNNTLTLPSTAGGSLVALDSSNRLLVGTSSARSNFNLYGTNYTAQNQFENASVIGLAVTRPGGAFLTLANSTTATSGDTAGVLTFNHSDGTNLPIAAQIAAQVDGTPGANDMPGRLVFSTTADGAASPTERMKITSSGALLVNTVALVDPATGTNDGFSVNNDGFTGISINNNTPLNLRRRSGDGAIVGFRRDTTLVGTISVTTTATAYNTSSDYRLKENIVPIGSSIGRLLQLKPSRFNFIADPDKTVDGFIAHEVQAVVPEAINGEKDAVDVDGNPIYQGIDQSKLVPLLTAALQEAITKIELLEARLTALEVTP